MNVTITREGDLLVCHLITAHGVRTLRTLQMSVVGAWLNEARAARIRELEAELAAVRGFVLADVLGRVLA